MRDYAPNRSLVAESIGNSLLTLFRKWQVHHELALKNLRFQRTRF